MFKYFKIKELFKSCSPQELRECIDLNGVDSLLKLMTFLDEFREYVGAPIIITSSFRNEAHNKACGGVPTSQHLIGQAIDFICPKVPFQTLVCYFREFVAQEGTASNVLGQVIFYYGKNFIHIGMRTPRHSKLVIYEKRES